MAEGSPEGQPEQHHLEAKKAIEAHDKINSPATPRQEPIESERSMEELRSSIMQRRQRIEQLVQESEKLLVGAIKFPDLSQPTPPKEPKKTGIRSRISEMVKGIVGRGKSIESPNRK